MTAPLPERVRSLLPLIFLITLYLLVVVQRAWLGDDAFITLRTVHNFVSGEGLVYNLGERVQSYTHPLWMLLLSIVYSLTREPYYTTVFTQIILSLVGVLLLAFGLGLSRRGAVFALLVLSLSNSFVDYSTSGLENSLTHLILIVFILIFFRAPSSPRKLFFLTLVASLGIVNRMDTGLLFLPALVYEFRKTPGIWLQLILTVGLGMMPFILWELFSLIYYGFLVPNTAIAKLNIDVPVVDLWKQGAIYLLNSLRTDPLTFIIITIGLIISFSSRHKKLLMLGSGVSLYLVYVISIGGDFMSGRFLSVLVLTMVIMIAFEGLESLTNEMAAMVLGIVVLVGMSSPFPTLRPTQRTDYEVTSPIDDNLIANERLYYIDNNLAFAGLHNPMPGHKWRFEGVEQRFSYNPLKLWWEIGMRGYYAGSEVHVVDYFALVDPLLARLPPVHREYWRIGHFRRVIPEGYLDTLTAGENLIADPELAEYFDHLSVITRGPIWSVNRFQEIWRFLTGQYAHLIDLEKYRWPELLTIDQSSVTTFRAPGLPWDESGNTQFTDDGLLILLNDGTSHSRFIDMTLDGNTRYKLVFMRGDEIIGNSRLTNTGERFHGRMVLHEVVVPDKVVRRGYDRVHIIPFYPTGEHALGHFHILGPSVWPNCIDVEGCEVLFNDARVLNLLHEGWSEIESWGIWSEGPESVLYLFMNEGTSYQLTLRAFPFDDGENCDQSVAIDFNDSRVATWPMHECGENVISLELPLAEEGVNDIRFIYDRIRTLEGTHENGGDLRRMGVGFVELQLEQFE